MIKILFIGLISTLSIAKNLKANAISIFNVCAIQSNKIKCEIVRKGKDNRGLTNQLYVYGVKMSDIKALNKTLFDGYRNTGIVILQIFYFDDKQIAKTYATKLFDKNVSNNELDRMSKHVIGKFEYISLNNIQTLHIGQEADMY